MTSEEREEIKAIVLEALLEYDEMKKQRRLKAVNKLVKGALPQLQSAVWGVWV